MVLPEGSEQRVMCAPESPHNVSRTTQMPDYNIPMWLDAHTIRGGKEGKISIHLSRTCPHPQQVQQRRTGRRKCHIFAKDNNIMPSESKISAREVQP